MTTNIEAIIFDMDGVIVDSELHWHGIEADFLSGLVETWTEEDQASILGMSAFDIYAMLVRDFGYKESKDNFLAYYRELAQVIYGKRANLIPGAQQLILEITREGFPLALASSSPHSWISIVLERFSLREHFSVVVSSEDVGGKGKPAPEIYLKTTELLNVHPKRCVAIEDSTKGVASAKAAGMYCIGLKNGHNDKQNLSQADCVVNGFQELTFNSILNRQFSS